MAACAAIPLFCVLELDVRLSRELSNLGPSAYRGSIALMFIQSNSQPLPALIDALSHPRLSSYRKFFAAASDAEALGLYQWNEDLSAALFRSISLIEIVLRNQFHKTLSGKYGVIGSTVSRDWYLHLALNPQSKSKIDAVLYTRKGKQLLPRTPVPSADDVISKLTFGFWAHLLDVSADAAGQPVPWGQLILDIVPGHRQKQETYWRKVVHQDALFARIDLCNELRNRIAHHEPIWKLGQLMEEARPRPGKAVTVAAPAPTTLPDALTRLTLVYERLLELLGWLSPAMLAAFIGSEMDARCKTLLSQRAVDHYRACRPLTEIDVVRFKGSRGMRDLLRYSARNRQPLHLKDGGKSLGHIVCPIR